MRWRLADRIDQFTPWVSIRGRKAISLEEYHLLERLGRKGVLPESLIVECCLHLARWLLVRSSEFQQEGLPAEVCDFQFEDPAGVGDVLTIAVNVEQNLPEALAVRCAVTAAARRIGRGRLVLTRLALAGVSRPEELRSLWRELYGQT